MQRKLKVSLYWFSLCMALAQMAIAERGFITTTGKVVDDMGKPVEGAEIMIVPGRDNKGLSDSQGQFKITWSPRSWQDEGSVSYIVARYKVKNLGLALPIDNKAGTPQLTLKPAVSVSGFVVDSKGNPVSGVQLSIMFRTSNWSQVIDSQSQTDANGLFKFNALPVENQYRFRARADGYGQRDINFDAGDSVNSHLDLGRIELPIANMSVTGRVVDIAGRPVPSIGVYCTGEGQPSCSTKSDEQGYFALDGVCPGLVRIFAEGESVSCQILTEAGARNIKAVVTDSGYSRSHYIRTKSHEEIIRSGNPYIAGRVVDENGLAVADVPVNVRCMQSKNEKGQDTESYFQETRFGDVTDEQGRFAIEMEEKATYSLLFSPNNLAAIIVYDVVPGTGDLKVVLPNGGTLTGRLVRFSRGRKVPVPDTRVELKQESRLSYSSLGRDRDRSAVTDSEGRFRFEHIRTLMRTDRQQPVFEPRGWELSYEGVSQTVMLFQGETVKHIELVVRPNLAKAASLTGRTMPEYTGINIGLSQDRFINRKLLFCFFDYAQRPVRQCVIQLNKRLEQLKKQGVEIIAVQTVMTGENELALWIKQANISIPVGAITGDIDETRFIWGVKSLPWLILTDRQHIVRAEGFGLDELDGKLNDMADTVSVDKRAVTMSSSSSESSSRLIGVIGVARDRDGKPVAGIEVQRLHGPGPVITDTTGKFELLWDPARNRPLVDIYYIIARYERENLSVVVEVPEFEQGTESVNLNLLPGVIFKGKVVDPAGRAIELAEVSILLHTPTQGSGLYSTITDSEGMFEFRGIPTDHKYTFAAQASGHGTKWVHDIYAGHDFARKEFKLEPMTLAIADQSVSGVVMDANDKPVSGARLSTDGQGQPQHYNVRTDADGKFTIDEVCTGDLRVFATVQGETLLSGYARTYGGATDVRIVLKEVPSPRRRRNALKTPPSLVGRTLLELKDLGIELSSAQITGKPMLICFFDLEQRPSRYFIAQLAKRAGQLKNKDLVVAIVHASKVDQSRLDKWIKDNDIPFRTGMAREDDTKTRLTWGIKSLPWLILTDHEHVVTAEGFSLDELDAKISEIKPSASPPDDSNTVTGLVKDSQGRLLSGVRVTEYQTDKDYTSDADGKFVSAFAPSGERRSFFAVDSRRKLVGVGRLSSGEDHVEIKLDPAIIVSGTVIDPVGKPVSGAQVAPLPMTCYHVLTDEQGRFDVGWAPKWAGNLDTFFLMARHLERNLAGGLEIDEKAGNVRIELEPALILAGTIEEPNGVPIPGAEVGLSLRREWACGTPVRKVVADENGGYEFPVLPQKQEYINYADAEGFWQNQITTGIINRKIDREQVNPIILKRPILSVTGTVLYGNKVVAGIPVYLGGEGQPRLDTQTDSDGRFVFEKVCCGPVRISAKNDKLFGTVDAEGGAKNVKVVVRPRFE